MVREVWRLLNPFLGEKTRKLFALGFVAAMSGLAEAAALLLAVRVVVDVGVGGPALYFAGRALSAPASLGLAVVSALAAFAGHTLIARGTADISGTVLYSSRQCALKRYVNAPWSVQMVQREGALQEIVSTLTLRTSEVAQSLAYGLAQATILLMFVAAAIAVDWRFSLTILGVGGVIVFLLRPIARATQARSRSYVKANSYYAEEVGRLASSSMELKAFGVEAAAESQIADLNSRVAVRHREARSAALFAGGLFKDVAVMLLIASVAGLYSIGPDALADAGVVVTLIVRGLAAAQAASTAYQNLSESAPNLFALNERLGFLYQETHRDGAEEVGVFQSLKLEHVSYEYENGRRALENVTFELKSGDFIGLVGPSGGGKSTLLQLILRLRYPSEGSISLNGADYRRISDVAWHDFAALVPQEPSLLEATISENIAYYRPIPTCQIEEAARSANIYDEICAMPDGFDTNLGPRGSGLSGGQKQRIAIARALAGKPELLVLDEPTSALDGNSEGVVLETIRSLRGKATMIIVAHRLSTVEDCDYLYEVANGTMIPADGSDIAVTEAS